MGHAIAVAQGTSSWYGMPMRGVLVLLLAAECFGCAPAEPPSTPSATPDEQACEAGDARACENVGNAILEEAKLAHSAALDARVLRAYRRGCDLGRGPSCAQIASFEGAGAFGAPRDLALSRRDYARGCSLGSAAACASGASLVELTVPRDPTAARELRGRACALGDDTSCVQLAAAALREIHSGHHEEGEALLRAAKCHGREGRACDGIVAEVLLRDASARPVASHTEPAEWDRARARTLFESACDDAKGDAEACIRLAWMLADGAGGPRDRRGALSLVSSLCSESTTRGCWTRGMMLLDPEPGRDPDAAEKAFAAACADRPCPLETAQALLAAGEVGRAEKRFSALCASGDPEACGLEGALLAARGRHREARPRLEAGCDSGVAEACRALGAQLARGLGGKRDPELARKLAARACSLGDAPGCDLKGLLVAGASVVKRATPTAIDVGRFFAWASFVGPIEAYRIVDRGHRKRSGE